MSDGRGEGYAFADGIPIAPIEPGSTVLLSGPSLSPTEELAMSLVASGVEAGDGALFVSTNMTSEKLLNACARFGRGFDPSRVAVVDCCSQDANGARLDAQVRYISTQRDLTGIGMKFSALYESLYANSNGGRVRTGLISLSSLAMYVDVRKLFRFAQTLSGRIDTAGGLGVFTIDPTAHDDKTVSMLDQVADGRIEVREAEATDHPNADGELRIRGLRDQAEGWQPFDLS